MTTTEVIELGEDGELFIVTGADSEKAATDAVRQYCVDTWGETLERNAGEDHVALGGRHRDDWAWIPVDDSEPEDIAEAELVHGEKAKDRVQFAGWLVSVA